VDFMGDTTLARRPRSAQRRRNALLTDRGFVVFTFKITL
jgi:hypothetical protein